MKIALYQPDIPQNVGAMIRLCACLGVGLDVIEPCGFPWDARKIRAAALDYMAHLEPARHTSWEAFCTSQTPEARIVLMTTKAAQPYLDFAFRPGDILLAGRESAGVPDSVHEAVHARVCIPMFGACRSLNIVNASAMVLGEALRQTRRDFDDAR
ncbi:MAG: tRNA (cytidine(34)-2'-O)-methyltransferase [Alphaproteobacteria bacterium]|nr:tRNA (cytidine(34)-2'-O)-methyltransferase [Alphaproteobacteria bacterium]